MLLIGALLYATIRDSAAVHAEFIGITQRSRLVWHDSIRIGAFTRNNYRWSNLRPL